MQIPERSICAVNTIQTHEWEDLGPKMEAKVMVSSMTSKPRLPTEELHNKVAKTFGISLETVARTI
jgi:hypothetical protein